MFVCFVAAAKSVQSAEISQPVRLELELEAGGAWGVVFLPPSLVSSTILLKIGDSRDNKSGLYTQKMRKNTQFRKRIIFKFSKAYRRV